MRLLVYAYSLARAIVGRPLPSLHVCIFRPGLENHSLETVMALRRKGRVHLNARSRVREEAGSGRELWYGT